MEQFIRDFPDYNPDQNRQSVPDWFKGNIFMLTENWFPVILLDKTKPITYFEIGAHCGANVISIMNTYASHPDSKIYCCDPWIDYKEYSEYQTAQSTNYGLFLDNISKLDLVNKNKLYIYCEFSEKVLPSFQDEMFDIIYIDGNHDEKYVLQDATLAFPKLKKGGWLIFDDFLWDGVKSGFGLFLMTYHSKFGNPRRQPGMQVFIQKTEL